MRDDMKMNYNNNAHACSNLQCAVCTLIIVHVRVSIYRTLSSTRCTQVISRLSDYFKKKKQPQNVIVDHDNGSMNFHEQTDEKNLNSFSIFIK